MSKGSWDVADEWYDNLVGEKGHHYHQAVVIPNSLRLLGLKAGDSLLDLGCGNGVLARHLGAKIAYTGIDCAKGLIAAAKKQTPGGTFLVCSASEPLPVPKGHFDAAVFLLSLQNMEHGKEAIQEAASHLKPRGKLLLVLNHPCFRIPRQSDWGFDEKAKLIYRRMNSYLSDMKIPIATNPGKGEASSETFSFHHPLSTYTEWLKDSGLAVVSMEEWCSDKESQGGRARAENRARREFPLFLAIVCMNFS